MSRLALAVIPLLIGVTFQASAQGVPTSEERVEQTRAKMMEALKPVCRNRDAEIRAGRKPKKFNAFLLGLPAGIREEIKLICDSM